jgi:hypothetical protein
MQRVVGTVFVACVMTLALDGTVFADPFEDGIAALERRDYTTALQLLRPLAENGNPDAQINLANMYFDGNGVPQDYGIGEVVSVCCRPRQRRRPDRSRVFIRIRRRRTAGLHPSSQVVRPCGF